MNATFKQNMIRALRAASFVLMLKGAVGGSLAMLALFGVAVPLLGIHHTPINEGGAAALGAVLGLIVAFRA